MTHFHWLITSWWCNMSDIFDLLNILEMLYYHMDTLATGYCIPWFHVKQTRIGIDNCARIGDFPLLLKLNLKIEFWVPSNGIHLLAAWTPANVRWNIKKYPLKMAKISEPRKEAAKYFCVSMIHSTTVPCINYD